MAEETKTAKKDKKEKKSSGKHHHHKRGTRAAKAKEKSDAGDPAVASGAAPADPTLLESHHHTPARHSAADANTLLSSLRTPPNAQSGMLSFKAPGSGAGGTGTVRKTAAERKAESEFAQREALANVMTAAATRATRRVPHPHGLDTTHGGTASVRRAGMGSMVQTSPRTGAGVDLGGTATGVGRTSTMGASAGAASGHTPGAAGGVMSVVGFAGGDGAPPVYDEKTLKKMAEQKQREQAKMDARASKKQQLLMLALKAPKTAAHQKEDDEKKRTAAAAAAAAKQKKIEEDMPSLITEPVIALKIGFDKTLEGFGPVKDWILGDMWRNSVKDYPMKDLKRSIELCYEARKSPKRIKIQMLWRLAVILQEVMPMIHYTQTDGKAGSDVTNLPVLPPWQCTSTECTQNGAKPEGRSVPYASVICPTCRSAPAWFCRSKRCRDATREAEVAAQMAAIEAEFQAAAAVLQAEDQAVADTLAGKIPEPEYEKTAEAAPVDPVDAEVAANAAAVAAAASEASELLRVAGSGGGLQPVPEDRMASPLPGATRRPDATTDGTPHKLDDDAAPIAAGEAGAAAATVLSAATISAASPASPETGVTGDATSDSVEANLAAQLMGNYNTTAVEEAASPNTALAVTPGASADPVPSGPADGSGTVSAPAPEDGAHALPGVDVNAVAEMVHSDTNAEQQQPPAEPEAAAAAEDAGPRGPMMDGDGGAEAGHAAPPPVSGGDDHLAALNDEHAAALAAADASVDGGGGGSMDHKYAQPTDDGSGAAPAMTAEEQAAAAKAEADAAAAHAAAEAEAAAKAAADAAAAEAAAAEAAAEAAAAAEAEKKYGTQNTGRDNICRLCEEPRPPKDLSKLHDFATRETMQQAADAERLRNIDLAFHCYITIALVKDIEAPVRKRERRYRLVHAPNSAAAVAAAAAAAAAATAAGDGTPAAAPMAHHMQIVEEKHVWAQLCEEWNEHASNILPTAGSKIRGNAVTSRETLAALQRVRAAALHIGRVADDEFVRSGPFHMPQLRDDAIVPNMTLSIETIETIIPLAARSQDPDHLGTSHPYVLFWLSSLPVAALCTTSRSFTTKPTWHLAEHDPSINRDPALRPDEPFVFPITLAGLKALRTGKLVLNYEVWHTDVPDPDEVVIDAQTLYLLNEEAGPDPTNRARKRLEYVMSRDKERGVERATERDTNENNYLLGFGNCALSYTSASDEEQRVDVGLLDGKGSKATGALRLQLYFAGGATAPDVNELKTETAKPDPQKLPCASLLVGTTIANSDYDRFKSVKESYEANQLPVNAPQPKEK